MGPATSVLLALLLPAAAGVEVWDIELETQAQIQLYACPEALGAGFRAPDVSAEGLHDEVTGGAFRVAGFRPGPSFWPCAEARLAAAAAAGQALTPTARPPRRLGPQLWAVPGFLPEPLAEGLLHRTVGWLVDAFQGMPEGAEARRQRAERSTAWVDDVIAPTGLSAELDHLEDLLEMAVGLPRSHSDPWHALTYAPGYSAHWPHTDCHHPGFDPENDRVATALVWLSPCPDGGGDCGPEACEGEACGPQVGDGATVFPKYGIRVRLGGGGLVVYSSIRPGADGGCSADAEHFAATLDAGARGPKVVLQKWYYANPTEPSNPEAPRVFCEEGRVTSSSSRQCKLFVHAPGAGSAAVQEHFAIAQQESYARLEPTIESMRAFYAEDGVLDGLLGALARELSPASLQVSAHWMALTSAAAMTLQAGKVGVLDLTSREKGLGMLRAALTRCPACQGTLSLIAEVLADDGPWAQASRSFVHGHDEAAAWEAGSREARELLAYARRLAALGAGGARDLAGRAAHRLAEG